jgi:hypothetical protein
LSLDLEFELWLLDVLPCVLVVECFVESEASNSVSDDALAEKGPASTPAFELEENEDDILAETENVPLDSLPVICPISSDSS